MKQSEFKQALEQRLQENQQIYQHPGFGGRIAPISAAIGLHALWILLLISFITTFLFTFTFPASGHLNHFLFGFLYV